MEKCGRKEAGTADQGGGDILYDREKRLMKTGLITERKGTQKNDGFGAGGMHGKTHFFLVM